jgi:MFS family permease
MNKDLLLVALSLFTWGIGEGAFYYFQPLYLEQLGATPVGIGSILGGVGIAMTFAHIPAGYLADKIGRRGVMWIAWLMGLSAAWVMALAETLPFFVVGMILYGMTAFVMSPMSSYITEARGRWTVGRALTAISATYNTGAVIGPFIGGRLSERYGLHSIYLFAACVFVASTAIILFIRPQPLELQTRGTDGGLMSNRRYLIFLGVVTLATFTMYIPQPLTPNYLRQEHHLLLRNIGELGAIGGLGNVVLNLIFGHFDARLGFILGQFSVGLSNLLLWKGNALSLFALGYFFFGGFRTAKSLATAQVRALVQPERMGLAYGIAETVSGAAIIFAPVTAGLLFSAQPEWIYSFSLLLLLFSLGMSGLFFRHLVGRKTAAQQSRL